MLILAGVTLNFTLKGNGIFKQATTARERMKISEYLEDIELARGEVMLKNNGTVTLDNLIKQIVEDGIVASEAISKIIPDDGSEATQAKMLTKEGYIFIITADKAEYAGRGESIPSPPDITEANISFEITKDGKKVEGWTHGPVQVAIKMNVSKAAKIKETNKKVASRSKIAMQETEIFTLQYSTNGTTWTDYKDPIEVSANNTTIYVCQRNAIGERSSYASTTIETIDTEAPEKFVPRITATTNKITIDATEAEDAETTNTSGKSGIKTISYSCHKEGEKEEWKDCSEETKTCEYTSLTAGTKYKIKVKVTDQAENEVITDEQEKTTEPIPGGGTQGADGSIVNTGKITFSTRWDATSHKATVTMKKGEGVSSSLKIQYQVNGINENGWEEGETANNLENGATVYARLWDGNNAGSYGSNTVTDGASPQDAQINITSEKSLTFGATIKATVTLKDNESGVDAGKSKWVINTKTGTNLQENEFSNTFTSESQDVTSTPTKAGTYYIHTLTKDKQGNSKQNVSEGVTLIIPNGQTNGANNGNITFSNPTWTSGKAKITIGKGNGVNTNLYIQYQIDKIETNGWKNGTEVTDIETGQTVYARLWDGTTGGSYASSQIIDGVQPQNKGISANTQTNANNVTITGKAQDAESGIVAYGWTKADTQPTGETSNINEIGKWIKIERTTQEISKSIKVEENGKRYFWIKDKQGNVNKQTIQISNIVGKVTSITEYSNITLVENNKGTPKLTYTGTKKAIRFTSGDKRIATINENTGEVTAVSQGTAKMTVTITNYDETTVSKECTVTVEKAIAKVGTIYYNSINNAINSINSGTVTVLCDVSEEMNIPSSKDIIIDTNKKCITGDASLYGKVTVNGGGTLNGKFKVYSGEANFNNISVICYGSGGIAYKNHSKGKMESINITNKSNVKNDSWVIEVDDGCECTIKGCTVDATNCNGAIDARPNSKVNCIDGSVLKNGAYGVITGSGTNFTVSDCELSGTGCGAWYTSGSLVHSDRNIYAGTNNVAICDR